MLPHPRFRRRALFVTTLIATAFCTLFVVRRMSHQPALAASPDPQPQATAAGNATPGEATQPAPSRKPGLLGGGVPITLQDLPAGSRLQRDIAALPPEARQRALAWLNRLTFNIADAESLHVDPRGGIYYVCRNARPETHTAQPYRSPSKAASAPTTSQAAVPVTSPPILHSRPSATKKLVLDFNGAMVTGTAWNVDDAASWQCVPYDTDGDLTTFSDAEQAAIREIWSRVAEDYAPFDVDVTTEEPGVYTAETAHALITRSTDSSGLPLPFRDSGGVAYVGVFGWSDFVTRYSPAFVYWDNLTGGDPATVAEATSHELGHNIGLGHDGAGPDEYYWGHGSGDTSWAPIMGTAYDRSVSPWSKGEYFDSTNTQDDLAILASHLSYIPDDAADDRAGAAKVAIAEGGTFNQPGVIGQTGDIDVFRFSTGTGTVHLSVLPFRAASGTHGGNLDVSLEILDLAGAVVASSDPADTTSAQLTIPLIEGTYYARISPVGTGTPLQNPPSGYTAYGSLGQYTLSGTVVAAPVAIVGQPQSQVVAHGSAVMLGVSASGVGLSYQWKRDGVAISGATDASYVASSTQAGTYTVVVSDGATSITSSPAVVAAADATTSKLVISHVAGTGPAWADGTGTTARFAAPSSIARDSSGNLYVADTENHIIRKVTPAGETTTLAGFGGASGTADGLGSQARFNRPSAVAVSSSGEVYVADRGNQCLRKISSTGWVTYIPAPIGSIVSPVGLAVDSSGAVYIADSFHNTVQRLGTDGSVATIAGQQGNSGFADGTGTAARFNFIDNCQMAVDASGNLYVADSGNDRIRRITPAGAVTTVAADLLTPFGVAVDSSGSIYYVHNNEVVRLTSGGTRTTFGGIPTGSVDGTGIAARFSTPRGLAVDNSGTIFLADTGNHTIRKITPAGAVSTIAGLASHGAADGEGVNAQFNDVVAVATDTRGNLFVSDRMNNTLRRITTAGYVTKLAGIADGAIGYENGPAATARLYWPAGLDVDGAGNVVFAEPQLNILRKLSGAGSIALFAGQRAELPMGSVGGLAPGGSSDGTGGAASFYGPFDVASDGAGNLYVADVGNHIIRKVTPGGVVTTLAGAAGQVGNADGTGSLARFDSPSGVAADRVGNVYVADEGNSTIRKITPAGVVTTLAGTPGAFGCIDGTGAAARFNHPVAVAVDPAGVLFVSDSGSRAIRMITPTGVVSTMTATDNQTFYSLRVNSPAGLAVGPTGDVFICDRWSNTVVRGRRLTISQISGATVTAGQNTTLSVVSADSRSTYEWRRNGAPVSGGTAATLSLSNIEAAKAGNYTVTVTTPDGAITSNTATVTVLEPPVITTPPAAAIAFDGNRAAFSVGVTGTPPLTYEWSFNGTVIAGATTNRLVIETTTLADSGRYEVTIRNVAGSVTSSANLIVGALPPGLRIESQPKSHTVTLGTTAVLSVKVGDTAATYQWLFNGSPISGATKARLMLTNVQETDAGQYSVHISATAGSNTSNTADLTVAPRPRYVFQTLAGGSLGSSDGTGPGASFTFPRAIVIDASGNLFVADGVLVRRVSPGGQVTTIAGGSAGYANGTGAAASFNSPEGIVISDGAMYLADTYNSVIRKLTDTGAATLFAGDRSNPGTTNGVGAAATFNFPSGIAADPLGILYVSERGTNVIRRLTPAGAVTTLAGRPSQTGSTDGPAGTALFNQPAGMVVTPSGVLVVADAGNHVLRTIASDGTVSTLAGHAGSAGWEDGAATTARFNRPTGLAADADGNLYVADEHNSSIRRVTPSGVVTTIAGAPYSNARIDGNDSTARFYQPRGIAVDAAGTLYIADTLNHAIRVGRPVPQVHLSPTNVSVTGNITLDTGEAIPGATYEWSYEGVPISGATSPGLVLANASPAMAGVYTVTVTHPSWFQTASSVVAVVSAPIIVNQPASVSAWPGTNVTFAVQATSDTPMQYQWQKGTAPIAGATTATLVLTSVQAADAGTYRCLITNDAGTSATHNAGLTLLAMGEARHVTRGYLPTREVSVTNTFVFSAAVSKATWQVVLPTGWKLVSDTATSATTRPAPGAESLLEWEWTASVPSALEFKYTLSVPEGTAGEHSLSAIASGTPTGAGTQQVLVKPDPLVVGPASETHSADTNSDNRIVLLELTRVIELYNTRFGTARTGAYAVQGETEDGFAPDPTRLDTPPVALAKYHSADSNRDGSIGLLELTRVIELYNEREGTTRLGRYRVATGTEDGFAPGP